MNTRDLVDHIQGEFHQRARTTAPRIARRLREEGASEELMAAWRALFGALEGHMEKEEQLLFPSIVALAEGRLPTLPDLGGPISVRQDDHEDLDRLGARVRTLSEGSGARAEILWFLAELDEHARTEEEELFPAALELERLAMT